MSYFTETFGRDYSAEATVNSTVQKGCFRITVLTPRLFRAEINKKGIFCDRATQTVVNRSFPAVRYTVTETGSRLKIKTEETELIFDTKKLEVISVTLGDGRTVTDFYSGTLPGTCRTLDGTRGRTRLGDSVISRSGVAVLDDSDTLLLCDDGTIKPRFSYGKDRYYFAYGSDYRAAVRDYFVLTGFPPAIPRYCLGNWWSRYKAYTQNEYETLMERFTAEEIPITVATIDMDWHWTDVVGRFGKDAADQKGDNRTKEQLFYSAMNPGWTGYSWNTDLFPDPEGFLKKLHKNNFRVTVNLHPASGCRFYEDAYRDFADFMGIDPESRKQIFFDITDPKFVEGYFRFLHHPMEEAGVDFWWIDWQQGKKTKLEGLDPLWALNHYHTLDICRGGRMGITLSRFSGAGSNRYPLGFSGDTAQTWKTLDFQPYFTSSASNIGYTRWSHDIGGHHMGLRDDELYLRWIQFGVFSPINRLHSTSNEFMGKEPWKYSAAVGETAVRYLRFRHRLIPYLYTMDRKTTLEGAPLICPLYYDFPDLQEAYRHPNEYLFGDSLIVCPITRKTNKKTLLAGTGVWLPPGRYTDIFSDRIYEGNREVTLYRDTGSIPVLAKEGAIIPLDMNDRTNCTENPAYLELLIFRGSGSFNLFEDDGITLGYKEGRFATTLFTVKETENDCAFVISPAKGDASLIPGKRDYRLSFRDITGFSEAAVKINSRAPGKGRVSYSFSSKGTVVELKGVSPSDTVEVTLKDRIIRYAPCAKEAKINLFSRLQGSNTAKMLAFTDFVTKNKKALIPEEIKGPLAEIDAFFNKKDD